MSAVLIPLTRIDINGEEKKVLVNQHRILKVTRCDSNNHSRVEFSQTSNDCIIVKESLEEILGISASQEASEFYL